MTPFIAPHRTLDPAFLDALEELATDSTGNWWRDVLRHRDLVLAVRHNSINAYYRGASIFRIDWESGQVIPFTHPKYLVRAQPEEIDVTPAKLYVALKRGEFQFDARDVLQKTYLGVKTLNEMCDAASWYAGPEKTGLHPMLAGNADVIDAEIALNGRQYRIDAAIATLENGAPTIRFYEAKHFTNKRALRASGDNLPRVVRQITDYEKALKAHRAELSAGYVETARALLRFNDMRIQAFGKSAARSIAPAIRQISETGSAPLIDTLPHLIIYGFDTAQRNDPAWGKHLAKLKAAIPGRVRAIGKPTRTNVFNR